MKFTNVEIRSGTMFGYIELEPIVDGDREKALGRALAVEMSQYPAEARYTVTEDQASVSIRLEVEADDFESLTEKATAEQNRFIELIRETRRLRRMLYVIERAQDFDSDGLSKSARK